MKIALNRGEQNPSGTRRRAGRFEPRESRVADALRRVGGRDELREEVASRVIELANRIERGDDAPVDRLDGLTPFFDRWLGGLIAIEEKAAE